MKKVKNILWFMPVFLCGAGFGWTLTSLSETWSPSWFEYGIYGSISLVFLTLAIWWINLIMN